MDIGRRASTLIGMAALWRWWTAPAATHCPSCSVAWPPDVDLERMTPKPDLAEKLFD